MKKEELRYLQRLAELYPTIAKASTEIINLQSILNLPKGTEHFMSDIHGEYDAFSHVLRNGSGAVRKKIDDVFGHTLSNSDKRSLATLIYYPKEKMDKFVTSRHLRERLMRELNTDVSLRVEDTDRAEAFKVSGRGELHLSILIETMRREGYEFQVSRPEVLYKNDENGKRLEPMELATIDVPEEYVGTVIEKLGTRKGEMVNMAPSNGGYTRIEFNIPARGLIGYRNEFLTDTRGNGISNTVFNGYEPYKGEIQSRSQGSLVAFETGEAVGYGLFNAQDRGELFIGAGTKVYSGMVVGRNARSGDMEVNVCKKKQLTNTRASGSDDALKLVPHVVMSLEQCIDFIGDDELVEVTPENLRIRKRYLDPVARRKAARC